MIAGLVLACLLAGGTPDADDVVPAAIDALLAQPDDTLVFGIPLAAPAKAVVHLPGLPAARALVAVGDVNGDGAGDVAVGYAAGGVHATLQVRDGATGDVLWSATPDDGGFRTLRALSARDGLLAAGACSPHARVECRAAADGALVWARDLVPAGASPDANVLAVEWTDDLDGDDVPDLLVSGGRFVDALVALSGADGSRLWTHAAGDGVAGSARCSDLDGDGRDDVLAVGGGPDAAFVRALAASDGAVLWSAGLPGPGTCLLVLGDVDGDGASDAAVGCFAEPASTLRGVSGADGSPLWTAPDVTRDVVSLAPLSDLDRDGAPEFAVGSFANAVTCVAASTGQLSWRFEGSTVNGGAMLAVAALGDLDGNGGVDVATISQDHHLYVVDGLKGFQLCVQDLRSRGGPIAGVGDADGDGRTEFVAAAESSLHVLGGHSGIAAGPVIVLTPGYFETHLGVFAYPTTTLVVMGSLGTGALQLPGYEGTFGLDLSLLGVIHVGAAPAAGGSGLLVDALSRDFAGLTMYFQAATIFAPGHGLLSEVVAQPVVD